MRNYGHINFQVKYHKSNSTLNNCEPYSKIVQNGDEAAGRILNIEICQKSQNLFKLKNMQNEIINKYTV